MWMKNNSVYGKFNYHLYLSMILSLFYVFIQNWEFFLSYKMSKNILYVISGCLDRKQSCSLGNWFIFFILYCTTDRIFLHPDGQRSLWRYLKKSDFNPPCRIEHNASLLPTRVENCLGLLQSFKKFILDFTKFAVFIFQKNWYLALWLEYTN